MRSARVAALAAAATATLLLVVPSVFAADSSVRQPPDDVPGVVTVVGVRAGGGSGEVQLTWEAVADATGYRVLRSDVADGEFDVTAELDVTTGVATASADVVNVFSEQHSYVPVRSELEGPDQSTQFSYIDIGFRPRCFRVIAFNAAGDGPASDVACGSPPGVEAEPPGTTTTTASPPPPPTTTAPTVWPEQPGITAPVASPAVPVPAQPAFTG